MRILVPFIFLFSLSGFGQYAPVQSQYMFNSVAINPAAAGSEQALSIVGSFRAQWLGFPGAPRTQTLTVHAPMKKNNSAFGIQLYADQIGVDNNTGVFGLYAYRLRIKQSSLRIGAAGGVNVVQSNYSTLDVESQQDQLISTDSPLGILPNFSVGLHWSAQKYFVSFSLPQLLSHSYESGKFRIRNDFNNYNFLLGGGYDFLLNDKMKIKPSILIKYRSFASPQFDLNTRVQLNKKLDVGISYRTKEALIVLTELRVNKQFSCMYSFGMPLNDLAKYSFGSHELSVKYNFHYAPNTINPRYLGW